jgi:hypothetical protein
MKIKDLPYGEAPEPLTFSHFPSRVHAVVWRNWNLVPLAKLAEVLNAPVEKIEELGILMGLRRDESCCDLWLNRGYLTIIRRNWHLLPYEQLLELLSWSPEKMRFVLQEEDFMWSKMGTLKPVVKPVKYIPLSDSQKQEAKNIRGLITRHLGEGWTRQVPPFRFLNEYASKKQTPLSRKRSEKFGLKLAYSYSAVYGDPLLNPQHDPYPDELLADYADIGINAVWLQGILYTLIPWLGESEYSKDWQLRLENLRQLVKRANSYGIDIYLYLNEPRGMPLEFFNNHPEWKGVKYKDRHALCTSNPQVLESLKNGVKRLFEEVPGLAGVFTITMSENLTNCWSRYSGESCPRCADRTPAEIIAEVNTAIKEGIHSVKPEAKVIVWNWCWRYPWDEKAVEMLPDGVKLMCVSETDIETDICGIKGKVADYTISQTGPGPTARRLWNKAKERGMEIAAKVQLNNTWECSAVPYIPVSGLIEKHLKRLTQAGVSDLMVGWTLGGWPGGNLKFLDYPRNVVEQEYYGTGVTGEISAAFNCFDKAFENFPLNSTPLLYKGPQNYGPSNLLFAEATGYKATMIGFPYDDFETWRGGHYPEDILKEQFRKLSEGWNAGMQYLLSVKEKIEPGFQENYNDLFNVSETVYCHFRSTYLQMRFVCLRGTKQKNEIKAVLDEEIELAKRLLVVIKHDSRIGFEASNHYYYTANDLKEKIINCEYLKRFFL